MTIYQLITQRITYISKIELSLLICHLRVEDDMKQHIAKLLLNTLHIAICNGVCQLKSLLNGIISQRSKGLLSIPRALLAQSIHHLQHTCRSF